MITVFISLVVPQWERETSGVAQDGVNFHFQVIRVDGLDGVN